MVGDYACQHIDGRGWGRGAPQFRAGLLSTCKLRGSVCAHRKQPLAKVTNKKLDERSPCSPSKRAGFRIVQFHDDSTKEVPSFAKIVASRTARAATAIESCRGTWACRHVTFPAFNLLFSFKHRLKHFHGI